MSFVLDASVSLNWCLDEDPTAAAKEAREQLSHSVAIVPPLWLLEMGNILAVSERRGRIKKGTAMTRLEALLELPIEVVVTRGNFAHFATEALSAALEHQISTYDTAYLMLALEKALPLATNDHGLKAAAERAGVPLLGAGARA